MLSRHGARHTAAGACAEIECTFGVGHHAPHAARPRLVVSVRNARVPAGRSAHAMGTVWSAQCGVLRKNR